MEELSLSRNRVDFTTSSISGKERITGLEVIKLFSSSAQVSMKLQLLINVEIFKINDKFRFKTQKFVFYPAHKC